MKQGLSILFALLSFYAIAQTPSARFDVPVEVAGSSLDQAWVGGLNNPQFGNIDLDDDGVKDLVIFDRDGNKILPFLHSGIAGAVDYTYAPEYEAWFPTGLTDWMILRDYNGDGLEDIFAYAIAATKVYKAKRNTDGSISFSLEVGVLEYPGTSGPTNIYTNSVDIPGIDDLNGDGDLDILSFEIAGGKLEYFENQSIETYGHADSLIYDRYTKCWGDFFEGADCNIFAFDDSCGGMLGPGTGTRHSGSAILIVDETGDGPKEILLSDVGCPTVTIMDNVGSTFDAHVGAYDTMWPSYDVPVNIEIFPASFSADINADGLMDVVLAPNLLYESWLQDMVWYYENSSSTGLTVSLSSSSFLVGDMLDLGRGTAPVFFDYDADGDMDLLVSNREQFSPSDTAALGIHLLENIGSSSSPSFKLVNDDFAGLSSYTWLDMYPAFGDIDGDGDLDMLVGEQNGTLNLFENTGGSGPAVFTTAPVLNYMGINEGLNPTPILIDISGDGLLDLVFGEFLGNVNYYMNVGTSTSANLIPISWTWGDVDVRQMGWSTGYSVPFMWRDGDGLLQLAVASEQGPLYHYNDIEDHITAGSFNEVSTNFLSNDQGRRTTIAAADLEGDGELDFVIGNQRGGLAMVSYGTGTGIGFHTPVQKVNLYPNPSTGTIRLSGLPNSGSLEVFDAAGRSMAKQGFAEQTLSLDLSKLSSGFYFVTVEGGGTKGVYPLVLK